MPFLQVAAEPVTSQDFLSLFGVRIFDAAMSRLVEIRAVFPAGTPAGTARAIVTLAMEANQTGRPYFTRWLLERWIAGQISLSEMTESTATLNSFLEEANGLPVEFWNIFAFRNLSQIRAANEQCTRTSVADRLQSPARAYA